MKCVHHNDLDGKSSGAVVAYFENNYNQEDYLKADYIMDLSSFLNQVENNERIYFVDYSFTELTKHYLDELIKKKCDIIWLDHHESSLKLQIKYPYLKKINGIRSNEYSGVALSYMYFNKCNFEDCPLFIKLISDYDTWSYFYKEITTNFKLALDTSFNEPFSDLWIMLLNSNNDFNQIKKMIDRGEIIWDYIEFNNKEYCDNYSYVSEIAGNKCLVVNKKSNSWVFGEHINEFPVVMVWAFNGEKYSYSIFSSNINIDCSKIAESYGGGGHAGAAGFALDYMPFKKTENRGF